MDIRFKLVKCKRNCGSVTPHFVLLANGVEVMTSYHPLSGALDAARRYITEQWD